MKKEQNTNNVKFTNELYISLSNDITKQMSQTMQDRERVINSINDRIEKLKKLKSAIEIKNGEIKELKDQIKGIKVKIVDEKRLLRSDKIEKFTLSRELVSKKNDSNELNDLLASGAETIDISRFYPEKKQQNKNTTVEFTSGVYLSIANNLIAQLADTRKSIDSIVEKIKGRKDFLLELKAEIEARKSEINKIKENIKKIKSVKVNEKRLLWNDRKEKFVLNRDLRTNKNNSKRLNTLYVKREETIDVNSFYPVRKQKTR